jgi:hypothetical protein
MNGNIALCFGGGRCLRPGLVVSLPQKLMVVFSISSHTRVVLATSHSVNSRFKISGTLHVAQGSATVSWIFFSLTFVGALRLVERALIGFHVFVQNLPTGVFVWPSPVPGVVRCFCVVVRSGWICCWYVYASGLLVLQRTCILFKRYVYIAFQGVQHPYGVRMQHGTGPLTCASLYVYLLLARYISHWRFPV